ncbi:Uma2 family endonuclease [Thermosynechococcus sp. HN-54]|uniref:Uma2 family endonuclease n=1 Tax=Thermosynechococcus sp. HN-54 TaxID=2933959 RepID=UPI00202CC896|nr:Uma2 family endonuclease [Thermosynechococcus sp. HN-54]URR34565.1 Uma2 family endonuclease [Thermosynechococcus sp. HN-54]
MTIEYPVQLPPLENGDRLTRDEFERRYAAMPHLKKAELIEGIVYVASPLRYRSHGQPHLFLITWLGTYCAATPGVEAADAPTIRLDGDNEPQPDAILRLSHGGRSRITADDYIEGAPELVAEIAASSAAYDLHDKLRVYRRNGVQEYLVWCAYDRQIYWFSLEAGEYQPLTPDAEGMIRSRQFPGLWLAAEALLAHDLGTVLRVLQAGIATPEHQAFVARQQR